MLQIIRHGLVELPRIFFGAVRKAVARQVHQPPRPVHCEDVDHLREARLGRDAGKALFARKHIEQG